MEIENKKNQEDKPLIDKKLENKKFDVPFLVTYNVYGCYWTILGIIFMQALNILVYSTDLKVSFFKKEWISDSMIWVNLFFIFILGAIISYEQFPKPIPVWVSFLLYIFVYATGWLVCLNFQMNSVDGTFNPSFIVLLCMVLVFYIFYISFTNYFKDDYKTFKEIYKQGWFYFWCIVFVGGLVGGAYSYLNEEFPVYSIKICVVFLFIVWKKIKETIVDLNDYDMEKAHKELKIENSFNAAISNYSYAYGILFWYGIYLNFYWYGIESQINAAKAESN